MLEYECRSPQITSEVTVSLFTILMSSTVILTPTLLHTICLYLSLQNAIRPYVFKLYNLAVNTSLTSRAMLLIKNLRQNCSSYVLSLLSAVICFLSLYQNANVSRKILRIGWWCQNIPTVAGICSQ